MAVRTRLGELLFPLLFGDDGRKEEREGRPKARRLVCGMHDCCNGRDECAVPCIVLIARTDWCWCNRPEYLGLKERILRSRLRAGRIGGGSGGMSLWRELVEGKS